VIEDEPVCIELPHKLQIFAADIQRIDEGHANALAAWVDMGSPEYLSAAQKAALYASSELRHEPLEFPETKIELNLSKQGIVLINLYLN